MMTFLHPALLMIGVAAAALPLVIHWLTRPRPVKRHLSTIRFVREALQQRRARHRLRDFLILLLRTSAILLLAWALARPLVGRQPLIDPAEAAEISRVVILDVSQSMAAGHHGIHVLEKARPTAATYLRPNPGLQGNLILAGGSPHAVFDQLSTNFAALQEELNRAKVLPERLNVQAALNLAAQFLSKSPGKSDHKRELVVVSDFQRMNWASADFNPLPQETVIQLESVAHRQPLANLGILRIGAPGRMEPGREVRLKVEVGNFSPTPRQVQVELELGEAVYRLEGLCSAGAKTTLTTDVVFSQPGWKMGEARLLNVQDALAQDNGRPVVLEVRPPPLFALITRHRAEIRPSSSYYLERALLPLTPKPGRAEPRVMWTDPGTADRDVLATADMVVLNHPCRLSGELIKSLSQALRRGRGILYVAAESTDSTNLKMLAEASGTEWQLPVEFLPPDPAQRRRDLFLTELRRDRPPFAIFGDSLTTLIGPLRFSGGLISRKLDTGLPEDVLAAYGDRTAFLVMSSCGAGTMAILNADLSQSNLPVSPAFVLIIGELVNRQVGSQRMVESVQGGEPATVYLPAAAGPAAGLQLLGPPGSSANGELVEEGSGVMWQWRAAGSPGVYQAQRDQKTVFALSTVLAAEESDLQSLEPAVLQERLAGGRKVFYHEANPDREERDDWWIWPAMACALCLVLEIVTLKVFKT